MRSLSRLSTLIALLLAARPVASEPAPAGSGPGAPAIVFMSDFGTANDAAALCRAVMVGIAPHARLMDLTHQVTPFAIEEAARNLESVTPYYPAGTVFVTVVDPGVGTARKALIVKTKRGQYLVLPDNGLAWPVVARDGLDGAHEITNSAWMLGDQRSSTFHGRDIFAPAAAHLAAGWNWIDAGPEVGAIVRLEPRLARLGSSGVEGEVIGLDDPYGNVITNVREQDLTALGYAIGDRVAVRIEGRKRTLPFVQTFGDVPVGAPLLYIDSRGRVAFAVNERDFSRQFGVRAPARVTIARRPGAEPTRRARHDAARRDSMPSDPGRR